MFIVMLPFSSMTETSFELLLFYMGCMSRRLTTHASTASVAVAVILIGVCLIGSLFADKSVQTVIGVVGCLTAI